MSLRADEFVERVRVALGAKNANALADALGLGAKGGQRVSRWLRGDAQPDYEATMLMLERVGWLAIDETTSKRPLTEDEVAMARRAHAELEGLLQRLQEATGE